MLRTRRDSSHVHFSVVPACRCQEEMEPRAVLSKTEVREPADSAFNFGAWMIEPSCF